MNRILEEQIRREVPEIIAAWFDGEQGKVSFEKRTAKGGRTADLIQKISGYTFVAECKNGASTGIVADAIKNVQAFLAELPKAAEGIIVPLVVVPFMGEAGRDLCAREKISWLDLSGNASVAAPRLKIQIEGKPNRFKSAGRPKNLFAAKSSRIARAMLISPEAALTQRELARKTGLNETMTGRVVRELERENFLSRDKQSGAVRARDPALLLDAWAESYQFEKHSIVYGFMAQRTGEAAMRAVAENLEKNNVEYAATGLAGAWLLSPFAAFRIASFYLKEMPSPDLLEKLKITEQSKAGGNIWLIRPNDEGVFEGAARRGGVCCAHPVQVYLDLKFHPERAREAAEAIRGEYLKWEDDRK